MTRILLTYPTLLTKGIEIIICMTLIKFTLVHVCVILSTFHYVACLRFYM